MLDISSAGKIRNEIYNSKYQKGQHYNFDIGEIMDELRQNTKYDVYPDDQLVDYAIEIGLQRSETQIEKIASTIKSQVLSDKEAKEYDNLNKKFQKEILSDKERERYYELKNRLYERVYSIKSRDFMDVHMTEMNSHLDKSRPNDPIWGQYSYEEILEMEAEGVEVPKEFLDWAHSMQDNDSANYDIKENSETDQNAADNLENETDNKTQANAQKQVQAFSSKSDVQNEELDKKNEEVNTLAQKVESTQEEVLSNQKKASDDVETMLQEWKTLDEKAQNGTLSETERRRYNELGKTLTNSKVDFSAEIDALNSDIDELMAQMGEITVLVDVNDKISKQLDNNSRVVAEYEGNKNRQYLGTTSDLGKMGTSETMQSQALGSDVAKNSAINSTSLDVKANEIKDSLETNMAIGTQAQEKVAEAKALVQESDDVSTEVTPPQETQETPKDEKADGTQPTDNAQKAGETNTDNGETVVSTAPVEIAQESDNINNVTKPAQVENTDNAQQTDAEITTNETQNDTTLTDTAQADPARVAISDAISTCNTKQSEMSNASSTVTDLTAQVTALRDNKFADDMKWNTEFKSKLKEYEKLANKAKSGQELTAEDLSQATELESYLNGDNGTYVSTMQGKLDILNAYKAGVENLNQLTTSNIAYGTQAVEQGKAYAESEMGDKTDIKRNSSYILLSKEKRYDLIYGKSGDSIGRDLIDMGESLISSAKTYAKSARNIVSKITSNFANDYSEKLSGNITGAAASVSPLMAEIKSALAKQQPKTTQDTNTMADVTPQAAPQAETPTENTVVQPSVETNDITAKTNDNNKNAETISTLNANSQTAKVEISKVLANTDDENSAKRVAQLNSRISSNNSSVDNLVGATSANTPEFTDENKAEQAAYTASVNAVSEAANAKATTVSTPKQTNAKPVQEEQEPTPQEVQAERNAEDEVKTLEKQLNEEDKAQAEKEYKSVEETKTDEVVADDGMTEVDEREDSIDAKEMPAYISENSTESDLETYMMDEMYNESDENAQMLNDISTKQAMENQAKDAAQKALHESVAKGGFEASGSATMSVGQKLNKENDKTETSRTRRFISYEDKNRRAALADKVENGKKVVMKRNRKK